MNYAQRMGHIKELMDHTTQSLAKFYTMYLFSTPDTPVQLFAVICETLLLKVHGYNHLKARVQFLKQPTDASFDPLTN